MASYHPIPTSLLDEQRYQLETLVARPEAPAYGPTHLGQLLRELGDRAVAWLTQGPQPRIKRLCHQGVDLWRVEDPISGQVAFFSEENEVRIWLEDRFAH